jgi:hypothetical protein
MWGIWGHFGVFVGRMLAKMMCIFPKFAADGKTLAKFCTILKTN